jgi:DNA recombination protein RmuC
MAISSLYLILIIVFSIGVCFYIRGRYVFKEKLVKAELAFQKEKERLFLEEKKSLLEKLQEKEKLCLEIQIELSSSLTQASEWKRAAEEKLSLLETSKEKLMESFKALSLESLEKNNQAFLTLAGATLEKFQERAEGSFEKKNQAIQELFTPMKESLTKLGEGMQQIEISRKEDQAALKEQMKHMVEVEKELREETSMLIRALRMPIVRGRWGELQLRRVVELCGMVNHCDFFEQQQEEGHEGKLRPDMIIKLPGDKQVIVDAKTPFEAYFEAMQEEDEHTKENKLKQHAKHVRMHILALGKKAYWEHFEPTPEFVVLFLPSESFYSAALEQDPSLIEIGVDQKVVIATPMTLIGLLRAIAYGWKQETLTKHTKDIYALGKELYKRVYDMQEHISKLGKSLSHSVESYNKMVGSLETRVLVSARKFQTLGIQLPEGEMDVLSSIEQQPKALTAVEFITSQVS